MGKINFINESQGGSKMSLFTKKLSAQAYFKAPEMNAASSGCGTACGAGDKETEEKPSACGTACGAGDK